MKTTQLLAFLSAAGLGGAISFPGVACKAAFDTMSSLPVHFVENIQHHACQAGCHPSPADWSKYLKPLISGLVHDGVSYTHIEQGEEAFVTFFDRMYHDLLSKCGDKLPDHVCKKPDQLNDFKSCIRANSQSAAVRESTVLAPYVSNERCRKVDDYFHNRQLWDEDFPARVKSYVEHCPEL